MTDTRVKQERRVPRRNGDVVVSRRRHVAVVMIAVTGLFVAACGARLDDDQLAAATAGPAGPATSGTLATGQDGAPRTTAAAGPGGAAVTTAPASTPAGGPAPGADPAAPAAACVPEGAPDVGVTEDQVTIGQVATVSGPVPGLGQTAINGVRAYAEFRNATTGGVCGRRLRVEAADDRLDTGVNRSETERLAGRALAFVGGWSVVDNGGAAILAGSGIPDVGLAISDERHAMAENFSTSPLDLNGGSGFLPILEHLVETEAPTRGAVVWAAQASARARAQGMIRDLESLGLPVPVQREVAITETNYVSVAQAIENAGVDIVLTALDITHISRLARAFRQIDYLPRVPFYGSQTYGQKFFELAEDAAEGAILGVAYLIAEDAPTHPGVAAMVEWYERVNPGADLDFFAIQGWAAAAMFADALERAGPAPTRAAVLQQLQGFTDYDAGGLLAPFNPAGKVLSQCFVIVEARGGQWQRVHPASGFACR